MRKASPRPLCRLSDVLSSVLKKISSSYSYRGDLVMKAWPSLVGESLAVMTRAESYVSGVLTVSVFNSSLYSLLIQREKRKILILVKKDFPSIRDIRFCIA